MKKKCWDLSSKTLYTICYTNKKLSPAFKIYYQYSSKIHHWFTANMSNKDIKYQLWLSLRTFMFLDHLIKRNCFILSSILTSLCSFVHSESARRFSRWGSDSDCEDSEQQEEGGAHCSVAPQGGHLHPLLLPQRVLRCDGCRSEQRRCLWEDVEPHSIEGIKQQTSGKTEHERWLGMMFSSQSPVHPRRKPKSNICCFLSCFFFTAFHPFEVFFNLVTGI